MPKIVTQEFDGVVEEIEGNDVTVRLHDLTDRTRDDEVAVFQISDFSEEDRSLLAPGAIFRWRIATISELRCDRAVWTAEEIEDVKKRAHALWEKMQGTLPEDQRP